ncbi:hypothetical protein [Streptomyces sp. NBC_00105]|uniref:hypothetical protein n=1 Tax=Streptomyces sp. NBC_00105 TaxID=2903622 RepID=UPI0032504CE3
MPRIKGTVGCVQVGDDYGFTRVIEQGTGNEELFTLWWSGVATPENPAIHVRIIQSDWVSLLRQAMAAGLPVTIVYPDDSNLVFNVQLDSN